MIASRSLTGMLTSGGRYALDVPVAALAGLSVAFLAFAVPTLACDMMKNTQASTQEKWEHKEQKKEVKAEKKAEKEKPAKVASADKK